MRIMPISFCNFQTKTILNNNNNVQSDVKIMPYLQSDTVSFGRVARNAEPLRKLMKAGMVDIWTGKPVIDPSYFEELLQRKEFSRSIKSIIRSIEPIKDALHKVPREVFDMLEEYAKVKPNAHLEDIFRQWAPLAQRELNKIQQPIFMELLNEAKDLPAEEKASFDELMKVTNAQLNKKPILQNFSKRDFRYKLERIAQKIRQRNVSEEVAAINKILRMSASIPQEYKVKMFRNKRIKQDKWPFYKQKTTIGQVKNFFERSALNKDEELQSLFSDVNCQIHGIPTFIPFGRLNFIESIKNIVKNIDDQSLAHRLIQTALKLPTANQEASAFIVKLSRKPSEKIGYDLLWGAVGNIDHIKTHSRGGKDGLSNYAVSTNYTNSERGNRTFAQQLRIHPEAYEGCKAYIEKLIDYYKNGFFKKYGINKAYVFNFAKKLEKISPKERPLKFKLYSIE